MCVLGCSLQFSLESHWRVEWNFNTGFLSQSQSKMTPWTDRRTEGLANVDTTPEASGVWLVVSMVFYKHSVLSGMPTLLRYQTLLSA